MNIERLIQRTAILVGLLCLVGVAKAQTSWDTNTLAWDAPTTCTSGQPIANCPVTQYQVQRAPASGGPYTPIGTSNTTTYTHTGAAAGVNCYVVVAISPTHGNSRASTHVCKTNVQPAGPPNPPTNLRTVDTQVFNLKQDRREVLLGENVGTVALNTICGKLPLVDSYRVVARSNVKFTKPQPVGAVLVARCA